MTGVDWLVKSAEFMFRDRPDIFSSVEDAFEVLDAAYQNLGYYDGSGWQSFCGFILHKHVDEDDVVEYNLAKKISSIDIFPKDHEVSVQGWTEGSGTLKVGVDLPRTF